MRILFADSNHPILHETLRDAGYQCDFYWDKPVEELLALLPAYDGLVIRSRFRITKEILDRAGALKCIARVGAGMENIEVEYARGKNISCICVPEGNRDAVGEHAVGMLLMLLNNLSRADDEVRRGIWKRAENRGTEIKGLTVGIIGYGNMGSAFAEKLSGFGCKIIAYDKYRKGFGSLKVSEAGIDDLYRETDVLSLHVPLTKETEFMVNEHFINKFQKQFYIINTARGKCLKTADLVTALESGKIKGACLDVLEYETVSFENISSGNAPEPFRYLIKSGKVILTPHIAGWTHESNYRMSKMIAEKIIKELNGA